MYSPWILDPLPIDPGTIVNRDHQDPIAPGDIQPARRCQLATSWSDARCEEQLNNVEQIVVDDPRVQHLDVSLTRKRAARATAVFPRGDATLRGVAVSVTLLLAMRLT